MNMFYLESLIFLFDTDGQKTKCFYYLSNVSLSLF